MESHDTKIDKGFDTDTIKYLLGELGVMTLNLIAQGCTSDEDIMRLSMITQSCLNVKIPLLETLALINNKDGFYTLTSRGVSALREITGWKE